MIHPLGLFTYRELAEEERRSIVADVLTHLDEISPQSRADFVVALQSHIQIKGFRNPLRVPKATLETVITETSARYRSVAESLLELWLEVHPDWLATAYAVAQDLKLQTEVVCSANKDNAAEPDIAKTDATDTDTVGGSAKMIDLDHFAEALDLAGQYPEQDARQLALMVLCLLETASEISSTTPDGVTSPILSEPEGESTAMPRWQRWLQELAQMSPTDPDWTGAEEFAANVIELAQTKQRSAAERGQLLAALTPLQTEGAEALAYFGYDDVGKWDTILCSDDMVEDVITKLRSLREELSLFMTQEAQPTASLAAKRQKDTELAQLEARIEKLHVELGALFTSSAPAPTPPKQPLRKSKRALTKRKDATGTASARAGDDTAAAAHSAQILSAASDIAPSAGPADEPLTPTETASALGHQYPPSPTVSGDAPAEEPDEAAPIVQPVTADELKEVDREISDAVDELAESNALAGDDLATNVANTQMEEFDAAETAGDEDRLAPPSLMDEPEIVANTLPSAKAIDSDAHVDQVAETATSCGIAASLMAAGGAEDDLPQLEELIWQLVAEDRLALAYHLARYAEQLYADQGWVCPSVLLRTVLLARHVRFDIGDLAVQLKKDFEQLLLDLPFGVDSQRDNVPALMLFSAALRPAVLAPNTAAPAVLDELVRRRLPNHNDFAQLRNYAAALADYGGYRQPLDVTGLKAIKTLADWQAASDALCEEVSEWSEAAKHKTVRYDPATKVWQHWQKPKGLIYQLLHPVLEQDFQQIDWLRNEARRLSSREQISDEVNRTDQLVLNRQRPRPIEFRALTQIMQFTQQAVSFAARWIELYDARPDQTQGYLREKASELRRHVLDHHPLVMRELDTFAREQPSQPALAGIAIARHALAQLGALFGADTLLTNHELEAKLLLNGPLLADPELAFDTEWDAQAPIDILRAGLLRLAACQTIHWRAVQDAYAQRGRLDAAGWLLEYLQVQADDQVDLTELSHQHTVLLAEQRNRLERLTQQTSKEIDQAVAFGLLRESERNQYIGNVQVVELVIPTALRCDDLEQTLHKIREDIANLRKTQIERTRERLVAQGITDGHPAYAHIEHALETGDALSANEYIDMVSAGTSLPEDTAAEDVFTAFFPRLLRETEQFLQGGFDPNAVVADLRRYAQGRLRSYWLGPLDLYALAGPQASQVADLVEAWFAVKRANQARATDIQKILENLGFRRPKVIVQRDSHRVWASLTAAPLADRTLCPVWQYGSGAHGSYRLMFVWDRPTEEDLLTEVGDTTHGAPIIVFYFNRMTEQRRRDLAKICRERRRTFIVIDDLVVLFLCSQRAPRLRALFECTLPFTYIAPYTTTAGIVPPEMFYGRQREREELLNPMGSSFIFGGRQLGKTALLREAERTFHQPDDGRIVLWLDLKAEGIGYDRPIDEIWSVLAREFKRQKILPDSLPLQTSADRILELVQQWLDADVQRRLLILLDEADRFLESDGRQRKGEEFLHAARIKGLMDRTNRRFKAVFAGLHNVQRTTRLSNHPLAHYGEPICIGPLLDNDEWREARALVERPMTSIGYRFESSDLVTLILSQTNYYPSLIQLYCTQLLHHLEGTSRRLFDSKTSPPYVITARHVNDVYQSDELRDSIRQRFNLTLRLDQRYEVIAHAVAYGALEDEGRSMVAGFPVQWIRNQALYWWPGGFADGNAEDIFRVLADEMVGLGILRKTAEDAYTLRSPNVVLLMGTRDDIERELLREREPALEYEPSSFRSAYRDPDTDQNPDLAQRSPLTAQQESELRARANGVSILFGCDAAGLHDVRRFLRAAFGPEFTQEIGGASDINQFGKELEGLAERTKDGVTLVLVTPTCPWNIAWVTLALQRTRALRSKNAFVRVLFMADPAQTWQLIDDAQEGLTELKESGVTVFSLSPWHDAALRQWLEDCGFGPRDQQGRDKVARATGNWPVFLYDFFNRTRSDVHRWERWLSEFEHKLTASAEVETLLGRFGLVNQRVSQRQILSILTDYGEATVGDLAELASEWPAGFVHQTLAWADLLRLIRPTGRDQWRIDPVVGRLLGVLRD